VGTGYQLVFGMAGSTSFRCALATKDRKIGKLNILDWNASSIGDPDHRTKRVMNINDWAYINGEGGLECVSKLKKAYYDRSHRPASSYRRS
jgi:hypothetical protein